jgi:signal transduction histidine kinase
MEEQNQFKMQVVNSFSHELRTPLNSATLFLKAATFDPSVEECVKVKFVNPALSSLLRQQYLINDIIDFGQINADQLDVSYSEFTVLELIREVKEMFEYEFSQKGLGLAFQIEDGVPDIIKTDFQRLL